MSGLAGFPFQQLNQRYLAQPSNDAANYGVSGLPFRCRWYRVV